MTWWSSIDWMTYSAALGGALWGVSLQPDFKEITLRTKAWRFLLAAIAAVFTGPAILHLFFRSTDPSVATFVMFIVSTSALGAGPIFVRRVTLLAKTGRLWNLPEDTQ